MGKTLKKELKREFNLPQNMFFIYLQLRHALEAQFRNHPLEWKEAPLFQSILQVGPTKGLISKIYGQISKDVNSGGKLHTERARWEEDIGVITQEQWKRILEMGPLVSVSPSQKISHLMLLNRAYYTPKRLFKFGCRTDDRCPRCRGTGDLIHMLWRCPKLSRYWEGVINS